MKVVLIAGTRPELIKVLPIYKTLQQHPQCEPKMILTGQHRELAQDVMDIFKVKAEHDFAVMKPGQTLVGLTARLTAALAECFVQDRPDILLVQGDTTSAMIAGMLGFYDNIPVGHVEAGLRTGNMYSPFPEEFNRRVLTLATRWHFAPTQKSADNLKAEAVKDNVHVVGNTIIDAAKMMATQDTENMRKLAQRFSFLNAEPKKTVLITTHRREHFGEGMKSIGKALKKIAERWKDMQFILPLHPNPNVGPVLTVALKDTPNMHLISPLQYDEMIFLIQRSLIILTDSGGIQEEAPAFNVPVLVMRNETERPEGIEAGCSVLVGTDPEVIEKTFGDILQDKTRYQKMASAKNPYGDGKASERIVKVLLGS